MSVRRQSLRVRRTGVTIEHLPLAIPVGQPELFGLAVNRHEAADDVGADTGRDLCPADVRPGAPGRRHLARNQKFVVLQEPAQFGDLITRRRVAGQREAALDP